VLRNEKLRVKYLVKEKEANDWMRRNVMAGHLRHAFLLFPVFGEGGMISEKVPTTP